MSLSPHDNRGFDELLGNLCNEALNVEGRRKLTDELTDNLEAQKMYVLYADLHVALRQHAQSLDDEEYALREAQAALDSLHQSCSAEIPAPEVVVKQLPSGAEMSATKLSLRSSASRWRNFIPTWSGQPVVSFSIAVLLLLCLTLSLFYYAGKVPREIVALPVPSSPVPLEENLGPAQLCGAVAARWAGATLEIIEGEQFEAGQRLELVEGLAEVCFLSGARVILQGPAILQIHDVNNASVLVGRVAATIPKSATHFTLRTAMAAMTSKDAEYGVEVDVDGTLLTQVYSGVVQMKLDGDAASPNLELAENQGLRIDAASGRVKQLDQASRLHFVRYLPNHEVLVNLADIVAGGSGLREGSGEGYHRGISLPTESQLESTGHRLWVTANTTGLKATTLSTEFLFPTVSVERFRSTPSAGHLLAFLPRQTSVGEASSWPADRSRRGPCLSCGLSSMVRLMDTSIGFTLLVDRMN